MRDYKSLSHTKWDCKYHVVFIPKRRQKLIFGAIRKHLGEVFHQLANQKGIVIEKGHLMKDHVHMCLSIPPKYAVSNVVGFLKGKSAISIARNFKSRQRNFVGEEFWARGYFVSTVGLDENVVREYIKNQEKEDVHRDQMNNPAPRGEVSLDVVVTPAKAGV
ncbi:IS200/IS605 family transposase [Shewanella sp. 202IG2-18]|uniref:IS200/IS605 family transposase n=1 Tax=Parashewanella hymeniacidonis TaxID=2807618 RepID=UPI00195F6531|nr:IS200/IS605 family transposase [Parashewanella hymeniacidonis]MBM7074365.1 IS200/IS605 family transposase [Parashewanella hymeniacidonis]